MAASPLLPPLILTRKMLGYYKDENQRAWMVAGLAFTHHEPADNMPRMSITVTLWNVDRCRNEPFPCFFPSVMCLPGMWQTQSLFSYTGTDLQSWIIVDHYQIGDREHLILKLELRDDLRYSSISW